MSFVFFLRSHVPNGFGRFNLNASLSYLPRNRIFLKLIQNHNHVGIIFLILKFWIFYCSTIFIHVICTGLFVHYEKLSFLSFAKSCLVYFVRLSKFLGLFIFICRLYALRRKVSSNTYRNWRSHDRHWSRIDHFQIL